MNLEHPVLMTSEAVPLGPTGCLLLKANLPRPVDLTLLEVVSQSEETRKYVPN